MSEEWTASDYVARAMSTRPVEIEGTDHVTVVTREALNGMAAQVAEGFIPIVVEHLTYIPPIGRWHTGQVTEAPDGEFELELRGSALRQLVPVDEDPSDVLAVVDGLPAAGPRNVTAELRYEARNFDSAANGELQEDPPFHSRRSTSGQSFPR